MTSEKQRKTYPSQVKATKFPSSCPSATRVPRGDSHPRPFNLAVACSQRLLHRLCRFVHINSIATAKPSCTKSIRTKHTLRTRDFLHLTSPDLTTKPSLRNMSNAPRHNISPPGLSTAIIVAVIISGTVVAVTAMLVALCYVTNRQRGKAQREQEGVEMQVRGCELEVAGRKIATESDSESKGKTSCGAQCGGHGGAGSRRW